MPSPERLPGLRTACTWVLIIVGLLPGHAEPTLLPEGARFDLDGRSATLTRLETLPVFETDYTRRFRFDGFANPKLHQLRARHGLDAVIAPGRDEFDRQVLLMDWTHRQFRKFGRPSTQAQGALEILKGIDEGHTFFCSQYAQLLVSAAASVGWVNRPLALRRHQGVAAVGGSTEHSVTEIWSNQHRKWVMLDPTGNLHVETNGIPLSAVEIRQEWFYRNGTNLVFVVGRDRKEYRKSDLPIVLDHFDGFGDLAIHPDELDKYGFIGFIPNTDLMDSGFDYGGMFIVKDALCDGTRWHVRTVPKNPAIDPYFPIGQASLSLVADAGMIQARLATLTPNLQRFEVSLDGGEWSPTDAAFPWKLQQGQNRLEARTVNQFGVTGPISRAIVDVTR